MFSGRKIFIEERKKNYFHKNIRFDVRHYEWSYIIAIYIKKKSIGELKGVIDDSVLRIGDIRISEKFRNYGIGTRTINKVLEFAENNNIKKITGKISEHDDVEKLLNFYKKSNFIITFEKDRCFVAYIEKDILHSKDKT